MSLYTLDVMMLRVLHIANFNMLICLICKAPLISTVCEMSQQTQRHHKLQKLRTTLTKKKIEAQCAQNCAALLPYSPLLTVLHGTVNGVASTADDITLGTTPQQSFDRLHASQTAGNVKRRLSCIVQLIYP